MLTSFSMEVAYYSFFENLLTVASNCEIEHHILKQETNIDFGLLLRVLERINIGAMATMKVN